MSNKPKKITKDFKRELSEAMDNNQEVIFEYWTSQGKRTEFQGVPIKFCQKDREEAILFRTVWGKEIKLRLASCGKQGKENALDIKYNNEFLKIQWSPSPRHFSGIWTLLLPANKTNYGTNAVYAEYGKEKGNPSKVHIPVYAFTIDEVNEAGEARGQMIYPVSDSPITDNTKVYSFNLGDIVDEPILPCRITKSGKIYAFYKGSEHKAEKLKHTTFTIQYK